MQPLVPPEVVFFAAHDKSKLLLHAPPKGGATLAVQLVLRAAGLESAAAAYAKRHGSTLLDLGELVHTYHSKVLVQQRRVKNCTLCSTDEDWSCIKLVRSPFDRVVSSYLRTAENPARSNLPEMRDNGSFSDFVHALEKRANRSSHEQQRLANMHKADHYLPQLRPACDLLRKHARVPGELGAEDAALPLVPIECVESALTHLQSRPGPAASAAFLRLDPRNLSAPSHYRGKLSSAPIGTAGPVWTWDYATHFSAHRAVPPYSAFLGEPRLRAAVGRLFADDAKLYEAACRQRWLQGSGECMAMCAAWRAAS
jgi:hypothetical protein